MPGKVCPVSLPAVVWPGVIENWGRYLWWVNSAQIELQQLYIIILVLCLKPCHFRSEIHFITEDLRNAHKKYKCLKLLPQIALKHAAVIFCQCTLQSYIFSLVMHLITTALLLFLVPRGSIAMCHFRKSQQQMG